MISIKWVHGRSYVIILLVLAFSLCKTRVVRLKGLLKKPKGSVFMNEALRTDHLERILETFSSILGCHLDCTDTDGTSIASSPYIRKRRTVGTPPYPLGVTVQQVYKPGTIVLDRRFSIPEAPCSSCPRKENCEIKLEIASPIIIGGNVFGVLAFAAYNDLEANWLSSHIDLFTTINSQLAEIVAGLLGTGKRIEDMVWENENPLVPSDRIDATTIFTDLFPGNLSGKAPSFSNDDLSKTSSDEAFQNIFGISPEINKCKKEAARIAKSNENVLIVGETGTGKELFARAIHAASPRHNGPFVAVNCASIPDPLLESEIFGYSPGSFTGALARGKRGKVEAAAGGTLFLDEIGDMSKALQAKILRLTEEKTIQKIGKSFETPVNVRIIAATNCRCDDLASGKHLRKDLFYRLAVHYLQLPPLRKRQGDVVFLAEQFLKQKSQIQLVLSPLTQKILGLHAWPGNVRELENCIIHGISMCTGDMIGPDCLPTWIIQENVDQLSPNITGKQRSDSLGVLKSVEAQKIVQILNTFGWSMEGKETAAQHLGISLSTLYRKIRTYGLKQTS